MASLSYRRLVDDHDRIESVADEILALTQAAAPDARAISTRLGELAIIVADHLREEDALLYPRLVREGGGAGRAIADELARLNVDWHLYLGEWNEEAIDADLATFREETASILTRLKLRTRRESDLLYASALKDGSISLR